MTHIWERLWVGNFRDAEGLADGNPNGITVVISLSEADVTFKRRGVLYLHSPIVDDQPVPVGQFDSVIDAIAENIRWGTVLLHCAEGLSQAPTLTAAWMATVGYKNLDAAIGEIEHMYPFTSPNDTLLESLRRHLQ
jgi:protein-tyrosine phosphatase